MTQLQRENIMKETEDKRKKKNKSCKKVVAEKNQHVKSHHCKENEMKEKRKHKHQATAKVINGGKPSSCTSVKGGVNKKKESKPPVKKKRKLEENGETKPQKGSLLAAESSGHTGADSSKVTAENSVHNVEKKWKRNRRRKSKIDMEGYTCEEVGSGKSKNGSMALRKGGAKVEKGGEHDTKENNKNKGKALVNISTGAVCAQGGATAKERAGRNKGMKKKREVEGSGEIKVGEAGAKRVEKNKMKNADMGVLGGNSALLTKKVEEKKKKKLKTLEAGTQQVARKSEGEGNEKKKKAAVSAMTPGADINKEETENRKRSAGGKSTRMKVLTGAEEMWEYDEGSTKKKVKIEMLDVSDAGRRKENEDGCKMKGIKTTTEDGRKKRKREKAEDKENTGLNGAIKEEEGGPKKKKKMATLAVSVGLPDDEEAVSVKKKRKKSTVLENGKKEKTKKKRLVEGEEVIVALRDDVSTSKSGKMKKMRQKQSSEDDVVRDNGTRKNEEEANDFLPLTKKKKKKKSKEEEEVNDSVLLTKKKKKKKKIKEEDGQQVQDLKKRKKHKGAPTEEVVASKGKKNVKVEKKDFEPEENLAQTDVVFLSEKMGNKDEVCIDRARREALQREIDRASSPSNSSNLGQWGTAHFDNPSQQQKFLRLMGGFKNDSKPVVSSYGRGNMALGKDSQQRLQQELLGEFERAQNRRMDFQNKGAGLGFTAPSSKKFFIDVSASRSIKFED